MVEKYQKKSELQHWNFAIKISQFPNKNFKVIFGVQIQNLFLNTVIALSIHFFIFFLAKYKTLIWFRNYSEFFVCRWIQMARRILSSRNHQNSAGNSSTQGPQVAQPSPQSSWRSTIYPSSRIAPASMTASRSEANLPVAASSLRLPDGGHHPSLDHYGGRQDSTNGNNHLTMLKTKVWYHSQRNVQEASVWKFMLFINQILSRWNIHSRFLCSISLFSSRTNFIDTIDHRCVRTTFVGTWGMRMKGFINDLFCPLCVEILESHQTFFWMGNFTCHTQTFDKNKNFLQKCTKYLLNIFLS